MLHMTESMLWRIGVVFSLMFKLNVFVLAEAFQILDLQIFAFFCFLHGTFIS